MWNLETNRTNKSEQGSQAHRFREQIGNCQRRDWWKVREMDEGSHKVQISSYKINRSWGCNVQKGDYSYNTIVHILKVAERVNL